MRCSPSRASDAPLVGVVATVVSTGVLVVAFGLLALGVPWFWVAFPVGYGGVLPLAIGAAKRRAARAADSTPTPDPLAAVKLAYARGDIDENELERRLERLLAEDATSDATDEPPIPRAA